MRRRAQGKKWLEKSTMLAVNVTTHTFANVFAAIHPSTSIAAEGVEMIRRWKRFR